MSTTGPSTKKTPAKKTPAKKTPAKKTPAKKTAQAEPAKKSPAKSAATKKTSAKSSASAGKSSKTPAAGANSARPKTSAKKAGAKPFAEAHAHLVALAMRYPEATKHFPWGELVVKVKKKVFVFFGSPDEGDFGLSVKLPQSGAAALMAPFAEPTGYGLGKSGWVSLRFADAETLPMELLERWIDESYRAVAPKTLVARLP